MRKLSFEEQTQIVGGFAPLVLLGAVFFGLNALTNNAAKMLTAVKGFTSDSGSTKVKDDAFEGSWSNSAKTQTTSSTTTKAHVYAY